MQPTEHWGAVARLSEDQCLDDVDDAEPVGAGVDGRSGGFDRAVPVGLRFDDHHGLRWCRSRAEGSDVCADGAEIDTRLTHGPLRHAGDPSTTT
jgi:hypothetical protein